MGNKPKPSKKSIISARFMTGGIAVLSVVALTLATGMLFIEPQLSLMIYALSGMALFIGNHLSEQKKWGLRTNKRITGLQKQQDILAQQMKRNAERIALLKVQVAKISVATISSSAPPKKTSKKTVSLKASPVKEVLLKKMRAKVLQASAPSKPSSVSRPKALIKPLLQKAPKARPSPALVIANDRKTGKGFNDTLSDIVVKELMQHAVKENDIEMFVQPILRLPNGETKFYEVFGRVRAREGAYIPASRYLRFARGAGVVRQIDNQVLMHCLKGLKATQSMAKSPAFFINVEPHSIKDPTFMRILLGFLAKNRSLAKKLVIEIPQDLFEGRDRNTSKILDGLKTLGCSFSMDHVQHLQLNLNDLHQSQVRFVKIRAEMMLQAAQNPRRSNDFLRVKRLLESNGIGVIVEKVENERMLESLEHFGLHYGQGYFFGRPNTSQSYRLKKVA